MVKQREPEETRTGGIFGILATLSERATPFAAVACHILLAVRVHIKQSTTMKESFHAPFPVTLYYTLHIQRSPFNHYQYHYIIISPHPLRSRRHRHHYLNPTSTSHAIGGISSGRKHASGSASHFLTKET